MLDPQFKSLCLVSSFVGREQRISIVEKYDWNFLQLMLLKCYHHLHHVSNCDVESTLHKSYENNNVDIFEMTISISEQVTKLVNREFLTFMRFQVDPKKIKCRLQW
jgi:hypothetical protein